MTCSATCVGKNTVGRARHHTTSIEPPSRLLTSGKEGLPVVRRAGWHCPDLALLSPPLAEVADLSIERLLFVRLPLVIAHPRLQRHGALNRVSANDETKRVSARVVKHPRDRRQTVALACRPERLAAQWLVDLGERGRLGEPRSKALSTARRAGEPAEAMVVRAPSASALATPGP